MEAEKKMTTVQRTVKFEIVGKWGREFRKSLVTFGLHPVQTLVDLNLNRSTRKVNKTVINDS